MENTDDKNPRGPKPKTLVEGTITGIRVGRAGTVVPPEQVVQLASLGCKNSEIADFFGVDDSSLSYNFKHELQKGRAELKISLRRSMIKNATVNLNAAVQIFLAKNILGMSDSPLDSEANAPLPWVEGSDDQSEQTENTDNSTEIDTDPPYDSGGM